LLAVEDEPAVLHQLADDLHHGVALDRREPLLQVGVAAPELEGEAEGRRRRSSVEPGRLCRSGVAVQRVVVLHRLGEVGDRRELAAEGAKVVVNDLGGSVTGEGADKRPAEEVAELIRSRGGEAVANYDDVADYNGAKSIVDQAVETYGTFDVVVNNAGILRDRMIFSMTEDDFDSVIRVHLKATWCISQHAPA